ncbi:MAG: acyltransferase family protein [Dermatophilaceae bacterium]
MSTSVRDLVAATPASRNRVVDLLRALAIGAVVLGHWLVAAVTVRDGRLEAGALLDRAAWTHPLTWVVQVMPLFFLVGGYANALSWRSARRRGVGAGSWLQSRLRRLLVPVAPLLGCWLLLAPALLAAGVPPRELRWATQVALVPTWFLAAYVVVCALAPLTLRLWERYGWRSFWTGLVLGGLVDLVSIGTGALAAGFVNYVVVWCTVGVLGYAWADGRLGGTARRLGLAALGLGGLVLAIGPGPYPVSMVGLDGAAVNNSYPTRVTMALLGMLQAGLLLAAEPRLARWLRRDRPWMATALVNSRIMTIYLWHLTVMVLVIGGSLLLGGAGLGAEPLSAVWWSTRPVWWLVLAALTAVPVMLLGRLERTVPDDGRAVPLWRPALATVLACGGLGLMAGRGFVTADGVNWWWPLLPLAAVALVHVSAPAGSAPRAPSWAP